MARPKGSTGSSTTGSKDPVVNDENWREKVKRRASVKFDDERKEIYLKKLSETGKKLLSAEAADIALCTVNEHYKNDPDFAVQYDEALMLYSQSIVQQIETEARDGHVEKRYDKETGNLISERKIYETPLRAMILKRNDEGYKDKTDINLTGGGGGVLVVPAEVPMEEFLRLAEEQRQKMLKDQAELAAQT